MEFAAIASIVSVVLGFLDKAKTAAPPILEAAKNLADGAMNLVEKAKANIQNVIHPTMTPEETRAALDVMRTDLDIALADVRNAVPPPLSTEA
jgi:hypothetical protein